MPKNPDVSFAQKIIEKSLYANIKKAHEEIIRNVEVAQKEAQKLYPDNPKMAQTYAQQLIKIYNKSTMTQMEEDHAIAQGKIGYSKAVILRLLRQGKHGIEPDFAKKYLSNDADVKKAHKKIVEKTLKANKGKIDNSLFYKL